MSARGRCFQKVTRRPRGAIAGRPRKAVAGGTDARPLPGYRVSNTRGRTHSGTDKETRYDVHDGDREMENGTTESG